MRWLYYGLLAGLGLTHTPSKLSHAINVIGTLLLLAGSTLFAVVLFATALLPSSPFVAGAAVISFTVAVIGAILFGTTYE